MIFNQRGSLRFIISICFILISFFSVIAQEDILKELNEIAIVEEKVMMPIRDGIRLATDIYRPKTIEKVPIIFSRTPYDFNSWGDGEQRTKRLKEPMRQ